MRYNQLMDFIVQTSSLAGAISVPSSKSHTLRAILFASLAAGSSTITHYLASPDTNAMINGCRLLGANIEIGPNQLLINGVNGKIEGAENVIDAGNSGLVLRFISAIAALGSQPVIITGDRSIRQQRPMQPLIDAINQLQGSALSTRNNGFAPLIIQGPLRGGTAHLNGADSQPVSALLIASAFAKSPITINVDQPGEKPWIDLTLAWLDRFNIHYQREGYTKYYMQGNSAIQGFEYTVPADWSSAAFPIVAALITHSEITLQNMDIHDSQGDKKLLSILEKMGAQIEIKESTQSIKVKKSGSLQGQVIDVNDLIDALPILSVLGCYAKGETRLVNGAVARNKECDRIRCIALELRKMGARIREDVDGLTIQHAPLFGAQVDSHEDHRMAMALAVAGFAAQGSMRIKNATCVSKTYTPFVAHFQKLGAHIIEEEG